MIKKGLFSLFILLYITPILISHNFLDICKKPTKNQLHTLEILANEVKMKYSPDTANELQNRLIKIETLGLIAKKVVDITPLIACKNITLLSLALSLIHI